MSDRQLVAGRSVRFALPVAIGLVLIVVAIATSAVVLGPHTGASASSSAGTSGSAARASVSASATSAATPSGYMVPWTMAADAPRTYPDDGNTWVRWFVGLGGGTAISPIEPHKRFIAAYNATNQDHIRIKLEIVPNANAYDVLKTEIAAGNAPDIIGPLAQKGRNGFEGMFLDLTGEVEKNDFDLSAFEPELVDYFREGNDGLVGLPYAIYPGYIWYNQDIFAKAGLPPLPTRVGDQYMGQVWDWNALGRVAARLTLDKHGLKSTDAGFDAKSIVQYGMDFQWCDGRRMASLFGGGSFVAADGRTAQMPAAWRDAFSWYYNAIWKGHFVPNGAAESSTLLAQGNSQSSGHVAMNAAWGWSISSIASKADTAKVKKWDIAVLPSWNGRTTSPNDIDTFAITRGTKHPDEAFKAMLAIMADKDIAIQYGGEPAKIADRAAYFADFDEILAPVYPGNPVTWSVLDEMARYPAMPSHESNMPNFAQASYVYGGFYADLQNTPGLNLDAEIKKLLATLQTDFDNVHTVMTDG